MRTHLIHMHHVIISHYSQSFFRRKIDRIIKLFRNFNLIWKSTVSNSSGHIISIGEFLFIFATLPNRWNFISILSIKSINKRQWTWCFKLPNVKRKHKQKKAEKYNNNNNNTRIEYTSLKLMNNCICFQFSSMCVCACVLRLNTSKWIKKSV